MGADQEIDVAEREAIENVLARGPALPARQNREANIGGFGKRRNGGEMLTGEYLGRGG